MSAATQILRRLSVQVVALPRLTATAIASGDLAEGQELVVRIRRVLAKEIAVAAGTVPQMYTLAGEMQPGESPEEMKARLMTRVFEDQDLMQNVHVRSLTLTCEVVALAVTGYGTRDEIEDLRFGTDPEAELSVDLLGLDLEEIYLAVLAFSRGQSGGSDRTEAFRHEQRGDQRDQGGGVLRDDHEPVPEPAA